MTECGQPDFARFLITGLEAESIPDKLFPVIQSIREHLLSILMITFHPDASIWPQSLSSFSVEGEPYRISVKMIPEYEPVRFDPERARALFVQTFERREETRLLVDGFNKRIPLQYRYLSLFKIIELHYRPKGQWDRERLLPILERFRAELQGLGVSAEPFGYLHDLRDRCAHIKAGKVGIDLVSLT